SSSADRPKTRQARVSSRGPAFQTVLEARAGSLWTKHRDAWLGPLRELADPRTRAGVSRGQRGMLRLECPARDLTTRASAHLPATEAYAWVDTLACSGSAPVVGKLAVSPFLGHLTTLSSRDVGRAEGMRALADAEGLASVRHLDLYHSFVGDEGVKALARAPLA